MTTIFVTHDQEEALDLADRVAILRDGRIEQVGAPSEIYDNPQTPFVFDFLGVANAVQGNVQSGTLSAHGAEFTVDPATPNGPVTAFFRPHEVEIAADGEGLGAHIEAIIARGPSTRIECSLDGRAVVVEWTRGPLPAGLSRGSPVRLVPRRFTVFPDTRTGG